MDGDRIMVLMCSTIERICSDIFGGKSPLKIGVVQTAYANSGSTNYIRKKLGVSAFAITTKK